MAELTGIPPRLRIPRGRHSSPRPVTLNIPLLTECLTGAVSRTLKNFLGNSNFTLIVSSTVTGTTHTFTSVKDLEREVQGARIYAGFHYHHSLVQGFVLGHHVAQQMFVNFFQPLSSR